MTKIEWYETFPASFADGEKFISISDGTITHCADLGSRPIDALITDYAANYSFNDPGEVECVATLRDGDSNEIDSRKFTIRSDDSRSGRLA